MRNNKVFSICAVALGALVFFVSAYMQTSGDSQKSNSVAYQSELLIRAHSLVKGSSSAPVTIVEFLDPECEACRAMHPIVKQLLSEYGDRVRFVIRYMPLHGNSRLAAAALEEARELGKYDQALDILFENQPIWGSHHNPRPELISSYLKEIGISEEFLAADYLIPKHKWKIDLDETDGKALGIRQTPTFFVNGVMLPEIGYQPIKVAIEIALKK